MTRLVDLLTAGFGTVEARAESDSIAGLATGFDDLDRLTHGLHPGELTVIAGVAGVGKSALALNLAAFAALRQHRPTLYADAIDPASSVVERILASEARIDRHRFRAGELSDTDWRNLGKALGSATEAPLEIETGHDLTLGRIRDAAHSIDGLALVVVDGLGMITDTGRATDEARWDAAASTVRGLKRLALELAVPVLVTVGVGRGPQGRTDKRPHPGDLAETSVLEYEADLIIAVYRDELYDWDSPDRGIGELITLKHRAGPTGVVRLAFLPHISLWANLAQPARPERSS